MNYFDTVLDKILPFEKNGCLTLENGAQLIGHAPQIAPEAYCHKLFNPISYDEILYLEKDIGLQIPTDYRDFLTSKSNGLRLFVTTFSLFGLRKQLGRGIEAGSQPFDLQTPNTIERPQNSKDNYFFIGGYGYDASCIYINSDTGKVHYCKRRDAQSLYEWDSFPRMLEQETQRIFELFDSKGNRLVSGKETLPI